MHLQAGSRSGSKPEMEVIAGSADDAFAHTKVLPTVNVAYNMIGSAFETLTRQSHQFYLKAAPHDHASNIKH